MAGKPSIYLANVPLSQVLLRTFSRLVVRVDDMSRLVSEIDGLSDKGIEAFEILDYRESITPLAPYRDAFRWLIRLGGENLERVLEDRAHFDKNRTTFLLEQDDPELLRLALTLSALGLRTRILLDAPREADLEVLKALLAYHLESPAHAAALAPFSSIKAALEDGGGRNLWHFNEEDYQSRLYLTAQGRLTLSERFARRERFYEVQEVLRANTFEGTALFKQLRGYARGLFADMEDCAFCRHYPICGGWLRFEDSIFDCTGWQELFETLRQARQRRPRPPLKTRKRSRPPLKTRKPPSVPRTKRRSAEKTASPRHQAAEDSKYVTFVVTEECNFRCTYCYLVHKNPNHPMPLKVAQQALDYLLTHRDLFPENKLTLEFIGGEPFLAVGLIEKILDYHLARAFELDHPWFTNCDITITTNGALYGKPEVQRFIKRFRQRLGITITVDGPAHVHDRARVYHDGRGTYQDVAANIPLWLAQFSEASTKVTISPENLPYLAESILHLFALGIKRAQSNVVFEDVWKPRDDEILEQQLDQLAVAMVAEGLWRNHECTFFDRGIGKKLDPRRPGRNWCGTGRMLAVDCAGNFYPCNRFMKFALLKRQPRTVGNVREGLDVNRVRPFLALTRLAQSSRGCIECPVGTGCAWCTGFNYDDARTPTIFQRATYLCLMHKARARANRRYWASVDALMAEEKS